MFDDDKPLTKQTMARLLALARGNNVPSGAIEEIESVETTHLLTSLLTLTPHLDVSIKASLGRPKGKDRKLLPSFAALEEEIRKERQNLLQDKDWIEKAVKELEKTKGHGWGQNGAALVWGDAQTILAASENCPTCRGSGHSPCPDCQGLGTLQCVHCNGQSREPCPLCETRREDPRNPGLPCPECHGEGYIPCRFCRTTGRVPCPRCGGKGSLACDSCNGTGFVTKEAILKKTASLGYALGPTSDMPSGLLRSLQRIGEKNLPLHADIEMRRANPDAGENPASVFLTAKIPYADIKARFFGKGALVSVFGKNGRLSGVPPFLDGVLAQEREILSQAAKGQGAIDRALRARAIHEALMLALEGKTHPNELRRLYPVGLSGEAAKEIAGNIGSCVRAETKKARLVIGAVFFALATAVFSSLFFTTFFAQIAGAWKPWLRGVFLAFFPIAIVGGAWLALTQAARLALKRRFHGKKIAAAQPVGKTGYTVFALIFAVYVVILLVAGSVP